MLFTLFLLVYGSMLAYHWALLMKTASFTAQQGSEIWTDSRKHMENGIWDPRQEKDPLYGHLFNDSLFGRLPGNFTNPYTENAKSNDEIKINLNNALRDSGDGKKSLQDRKFAQLRAAIYTGLSKGVLRPASTTLRIEYENILVQRKIQVTIVQEFRTPFSAMINLLTGKPVITLKAAGVSVVTEPAEYIRNVDLGMEYAARAKESFDFSGKIEEIMNKVRGGFFNRN